MRHGRRAGFVGLFLLFVGGCVQSPLELGGQTGGALGLPENTVPDPSYKARVGDRALLLGKGPDAPWDMVALLKDMTAFDKYERAVQAKDTSCLSDMEQEGWLVRTPNGTRVSVLSLRDRGHVTERAAAEVRVLDGPHKDQTHWIPAPLITRLMQVTPKS